MTTVESADTGRETSYLIGNCRFRVLFSSLTEVPADALVSSDNNYLTMSRGVSAALLEAGGRQVGDDVDKHIPVGYGQVVVTSAGRLPARYVFHAVTNDHDRELGPDEECLRQVVGRCLELAEALRLRHLAFPALGTGRGRIPFEVAADVMTRTIADFLSRQAQHLAEVTLALLPGSDGAGPAGFDLFYERAVGLATQWADSRQLGQLVDRLGTILVRTDSEPLREQARGLRERLAATERVLAAPVPGTLTCGCWTG